MEVTPLITQLDELRAKHKDPVPYIELIEYAVKEQIARAVGVAMPPLLTDDQRKVFLQNIDHLAGFLASDNGANAVEILMDAFARYTEVCDAAPAAVAPEPEASLARHPADDEESELPE